MAISYFDQECTACEDIRVFQRFESIVGTYITCMECGYRVFEELEEENDDVPENTSDY